MLRLTKIGLVFAVAIFYSLVVFNNLTDYDSNYQFVRHVLMMDTTIPGNRGMWRAVDSPALHTAFYFGIILWEGVTMLLCWWGGVRLAGALRRPALEFHQAKRVAIAGLAVGLLLWFFAFLTIGGEWFLMWQSMVWNGQQAAARMFMAVGIALLVVMQPDSDPQP